MSPQPPVNIKWEISGRGILLKWEKSPSDDVKGYVVYRAPYLGGGWKRLTKKLIDNLSFNDRWIKPGNVYGVSAVDTSGNEGVKATLKTKKKEGKK